MHINTRPALVVRPSNIERTERSSTTPIPVERGAHVACLLEIAFARGLVSAHVKGDQHVLLGERGAVLVAKCDRVTSVRVLFVGEDEWRTIDVAIAPDISPIARYLAGSL